MKNCKQCGDLFEPSNHQRVYCSPQCRELGKEKISQQWRKDNPERVKANSYRAASKNYRAGKLPSWMFS